MPQTLTKGGVIPVVVGKAGAYFVLYTVNIVITQLWVYHWFNLPDKATLLPALAFFIGLTIYAIWRKKQFDACCDNGSIKSRNTPPE